MVATIEMIWRLEIVTDIGDGDEGEDQDSAQESYGGNRLPRRTTGNSRTRSFLGHPTRN